MYPWALQVDNTLVAESVGEVLAPAFVPANYPISFGCVILPEGASIPVSGVLTRFTGAANPALHFVNRPGRTSISASVCRRSTSVWRRPVFRSTSIPRRSDSTS